MRFQILFFIFFVSIGIGFSQTDNIEIPCSKYIKEPFISDGQQYKSMLNDEEIAEFHITFYGGSVYRLVGCLSEDGKEQPIHFTVYDTERNPLYSNKEHNFAPYWDLKFDHTVECIVETQLIPEKNTSGFAVILIGFKK